VKAWSGCSPAARHLRGSRRQYLGLDYQDNLPRPRRAVAIAAARAIIEGRRPSDLQVQSDGKLLLTVGKQGNRPGRPDPGPSISRTT
jgi:hypothetical protein